MAGGGDVDDVIKVAEEIELVLLRACSGLSVHTVHRSVHTVHQAYPCTPRTVTLVLAGPIRAHRAPFLLLRAPIRSHRAPLSGFLKVTVQAGNGPCTPAV